MPFDSEGNFTRIHNWEDDRVNDIDIVTDHHDEEDDNFAADLSQTLLRDGRVALTGNFDAGNFQIKNLGKATTSTDAVNKQQLDDASSGMNETFTTLLNQMWTIGDIKTSVRTANHDNWFLCDGQAVSRTDYADLFALIGTTYGTGDGINTFNLPDCRGVVIRGVDNGRGLDPDRVLGSYQDDALQKHVHKVTVKHSGESGGTGNYLAGASYERREWTTNSGDPVSADEQTTVRTASETRMKNIAFNFFIKVKEEE